MPSAFIPSGLGYPAMELALQQVHQRPVHPGPLVLRTAPLKYLTPAPDRDRTVSVSYTHLMAVYDQILAADGTVEFKTDNKGLFDYSLEAIPEAGWTITAHTFDLHHDPVMCAGNVMTEYEEKFSSMGNPICKLIAMREPKENKEK